MNAKFNLPDFYIGDSIYNELIALFKKYPEIIIPNTEISCIYGNFPSSIWNGGGFTFGNVFFKQQMKDLIAFYNEELNLPLRFTFTNPLINDTQIYDTYSNLIAECGHNGKNEILTSSPILEKYLKQHYPRYKYCRSILAAEIEPYKIEKDTYLTVLKRDKNNDWEYLNSIPSEDRPKIEFLCTDPCPDNCPRIYSHYRDLARAQLEYSNNTKEANCSMGKVKGKFTHLYRKTQLRTYISREDIDLKYLPKGFNQFKISGRGHPYSIVTGICDYLIKPEYHQDVTGILLNPYLKF